MGFAAVGHDIFKSLDDDHSGVVSYHELMQSLNKGAKLSSHTQQLMTTLMWSSHGDDEADPAQFVDTSGWKIKGQDAETVLKELQTLLQQRGVSVANLIKVATMVELDIVASLNSSSDCVPVPAVRSSLGRSLTKMLKHLCLLTT